MKKIILFTSMAVFALATAGQAQITSVIAGGPHDLSAGSAVRTTNTTINGQTCIFCHAAHGGSNAIPLWNRTAPTGGSYQLYDSTTTDSKTTAATLAGSSSGACMSCHDGTIAMDVLVNVNGVAFGPAVAFTAGPAPKATYSTTAPGSNNRMSAGLPFLGTDLRNDHPVSIVYETARAATTTEYQLQTIVGSKISVGPSNPLPLFGTTTANATVECASCHNAHNNSLGNFLRKANTGSAICLSCHIK